MIDRDILVNRFMKYVSFDTQSDEDNNTVCPSTKGQTVLAQYLAEELRRIGLSDVSLDEHGYVMATLPANGAEQAPVVGFISHLDTSPDAPGGPVKPRIVTDYDGGDIVLNQEEKIILSPQDFPGLLAYTGQDIMVTDGKTLLGADDKAGVTAIVSAAEYLLQHRDIPHGTVRIGFTPDEETGRSALLFDVAKFAADFAYTVDGGELGGLEYENFNAASAFVTFHGVSIHPGSAKNKMINAVLLAMEFQRMMPENQKPEYTQDREGFIHLDGIEGSVEKTVSEYIIRDHDMELFREKKQFMERTAAYMNEKYGKGTVELKLEDSYFNMKQQIEPHMNLIENVLTVYEKLDIRPQRLPNRGGTDGAQLSFKGLPCPNLGTGDHNCHGHFEFVCVQAMEKCVDVIVELAKMCV